MKRRKIYTFEEFLTKGLVKNSKIRVKPRCLKEGLLKNECYICGLGPEWNNKKITLQIDHINGVNNDNRLKNLRILCPNCHTQTPTYGGTARENNKITLTCKACKKEFIRLISHEKSRDNQGRKDGPYCSKGCSAAPNGLKGLNVRYGEERLPEFTKLTCVYCLKDFKRKTNQARFKSENVTLCSRACVSRYNAEQNKKVKENGTCLVTNFVNNLKLCKNGYPSDTNLLFLSLIHGGQSALAKRLGVCVQAVSQKVLKVKKNK